MARVEVITGPERRRRWSAEQKRAIVAESLTPGAVITEIARRADICPGQIYRWPFRFPREVIEHAVWLYHCFSLSLRDVQLILAARGIVVSYESYTAMRLRRWLRFKARLTVSAGSPGARASPSR